MFKFIIGNLPVLSIEFHVVIYEVAQQYFLFILLGHIPFIADKLLALRSKSRHYRTSDNPSAIFLVPGQVPIVTNVITV